MSYKNIQLSMTINLSENIFLCFLLLKYYYLSINLLFILFILITIKIYVIIYDK
ncbi:hypothetical protein CNEO4_100099 [Clostridium neonatale]|nr:hypothetical protein CNEO_640047 [Clostridium neonatale]CAI3553904.1 hypothetical protein CNEO4_100099 [Clostridium neonatale]